jgi:hypothetical protein
MENYYKDPKYPPTYRKIKKGTFLFRSAPNICNYSTPKAAKQNVIQCSDTGKTGIYFATLPIISIAMCIEYNKLMEIGVFELTDDIYIHNDKYSFRYINPERYFDKFGEMKVDVIPTEEENISHILCNLQLLATSNPQAENPYLLPNKKQELINLSSCEVFLTKLHIPKIKFIMRFKFNTDIVKDAKVLEQYMKINDYPEYLEKYVTDKILTPLQCAQSMLDLSHLD